MNGNSSYVFREITTGSSLEIFAMVLVCLQVWSVVCAGIKFGDRIIIQSYIATWKLHFTFATQVWCHSYVYRIRNPSSMFYYYYILDCDTDILLTVLFFC